MDRQRLLELGVHYAAMLLLSLIAVTAVRLAIGDIGIWIRLGTIALVVLLYRPLVLALGVAPTAWEESQRVRDR